jgi:DNA-binding CsgD family transcriptional regulator
VANVINLDRKISQSNQQKQASFTLVDGYFLPVIAVDADGRVRFINQAARRSLYRPFASSPQSLLTNEDIALQDAEFSREIEKTLRIIPSRHFSSGVHASIRLNNSTHKIWVSQISEYHDLSNDGLYWIYLLEEIDIEKCRQSDRYKSLNLTQSESFLVSQLLEGKSFGDIAITRNVSIQTIRKQFRSIYVKTGTHCQESLLIFMFKTMFYCGVSRH